MDGIEVQVLEKKKKKEEETSHMYETMLSIKRWTCKESDLLNYIMKMLEFNTQYILNKQRLYFAKQNKVGRFLKAANYRLLDSQVLKFTKSINSKEIKCSDFFPWVNLSATLKVDKIPERYDYAKLLAQ